LCVGLWLSALETTIVATVLVSVASSLGDFHRSNWIVTSYLLTYTGFLTIFARCSDVFGRKTILLIGLVIFTLASYACGLANSMIQLIIFRAFQGLGGAGIYSLAMRVLTEIPDEKTMGPVAGLIGMVFACSSIAGPLLGGAIASTTNWNWVFFLNVPAGAILIVLAAVIFPNNEKPLHNTFKDILRVDWIGCWLSLAFIALLIFALESGGNEFEWNSAQITTSLVGSVACILLFGLWEAYLGKLPEDHPTLPIFPFRLLKNWTLNIALITAFIIGFPFMITIIYLPQSLQVAASRSTIRAGIDIIPLLIFSALGSGLGGAFCARKPIEREILTFSFALQLLGLGLLYYAPLKRSVTAGQYAYECIAGLGFGFSLSTIVIVARRAVQPDDLSVAMGFITQIRVLGALVGVACTQTLLNAVTRRDLVTFLGPADMAALRDSIQTIGKFPREQQEAVRSSYARGYKSQIIVSLGTAAAGFIIVLCMSIVNRRKSKTAEKRVSEHEEERELQRVSREPSQDLHPALRPLEDDLQSPPPVQVHSYIDA
ncbi:MFS general substrate transporter, partial [Zopfia rhizophila CBS 207.26]